MDSKVVDFNARKTKKTNDLKNEYERKSNMIDDMYWIVAAMEKGMISGLDMVFEYDGQIVYYGSQNDKKLSEIISGVSQKVVKIRAKARID